MPGDRKGLVAQGLKQVARAVNKPRAARNPDSPSKWAHQLWQQRREQRERWTEPGASFPVGQKKVYLPGFRVTLQYSPWVPPTHAQFEVPLFFSKLDLRDYLWHTYSLKTSAIRSQVLLQPIRFVRRQSFRDIAGKRDAYRPKSLKRMIVRLEKPFVWPKPPDEETQNMRYNKDTAAKLSATQDDLGGRFQKGPSADLGDDERRGNALVRIANALLSGKEVWKGEVSQEQTSSSGRPMRDAETGSEPGPDASTTDRKPAQTAEELRLKAHAERVMLKAKMLKDSGIKPAASGRRRANAQ